jgi:hypothetical protein
MSPAHATPAMRQRLQVGTGGASEALHSWVGIIMYLPTHEDNDETEESSGGESSSGREGSGDDTAATRHAITDAFMR